MVNDALIFRKYKRKDLNLIEKRPAKTGLLNVTNINKWSYQITI